MKNVRYEYEIVCKETGKVLEKAFVREDARYLKQDWKFNGSDVKIVQRKFQYTESKEVR